MQVIRILESSLLTKGNIIKIFTQSEDGKKPSDDGQFEFGFEYD